MQHFCISKANFFNKYQEKNKKKGFFAFQEETSSRIHSRYLILYYRALFFKIFAHGKSAKETKSNG